MHEAIHRRQHSSHAISVTRKGLVDRRFHDVDVEEVEEHTFTCQCEGWPITRCFSQPIYCYVRWFSGPTSRT